MPGRRVNVSGPPKAKRSKSGVPFRATGSSIVRPVRVNVGPQPFAKQRRCSLKYVTIITDTLVSQTLDLQFSANGLFQPNLGGADHQPMYFDELMAIYRSYQVMGSKIRVTPLVATSTIPYLATIVVSESTTSLSGISVAAEQPRASFILKWDVANKVLDSVSNSYNSEIVYGKTPLGINAGLNGSVAANPQLGQQYHIVTETPTGGDTNTIQFLVEIEYDTIFTDLIPGSQS